jgi:hypothetical protein
MQKIVGSIPTGSIHMYTLGVMFSFVLVVFWIYTGFTFLYGLKNMVSMKDSDSWKVVGILFVLFLTFVNAYVAVHARP